MRKGLAGLYSLCWATAGVPDDLQEVTRRADPTVTPGGDGQERLAPTGPVTGPDIKLELWALFV